MGCGYSEPFEKEWAAHYKSYGALRLSKSDVYRLWRVFADIDTGTNRGDWVCACLTAHNEISCAADRRGTISYEEFLNYFDFDKSLFVKRAFDVMDEDASGAIVRRVSWLCFPVGRRLKYAVQGFFEFVVGMWNYCTYSTHASRGSISLNSSIDIPLKRGVWCGRRHPGSHRHAYICV
jgi:hypothetical protein